MEDPTEEPDLRPPGAAEEPATEPRPVSGGQWPAGGEQRLVSGGHGPVGDGQRPVGDGQSAVRGGVWSATGEPRVDAALARLDELEGLPVTEHRAVFEDVHERLSEVLGELAAGQTPAAGQVQAEAHPGRPGR
jgi:hypothetical protein